MALDARIRELGSRHQSLEQAIQDELRRPHADDIRLRQLKRQKLKLKEEIETLRGRLH
ncbi:YdcH family protein [Phenylobacterium sp.]|uniref:YdcH family protein n=1 Tax=Phenylobacterium sp. TaxID=1871053 RepID=UPI0037C886B9